MGFEDHFFKYALKLLLRDVEIITESDVPSSNLRIDFLLLKEKNQLLASPLTFLAPYSVVVGEYKSFKDRLKSEALVSLAVKGLLLLDTVLKGKNLEELVEKKNGEKKGHNFKKSQKVKSRFGKQLSDYALLLFLGGNNRLDKNIFSSLHTNPEKIESLKRIAEGIYVVQSNCFLSMDFFIVSLKELPINKNTRVLKFFATPEDRFLILEQGIADGDELIYVLGLYYNKELVIELSKSLFEEVYPSSEAIKEATEFLGIERVVEAVGLEKVIDAVGIEKVIEAVGLEKVIDAVGIEKVALGLKQALKNASSEEKKKVVKILKELIDVLDK